MANEMVRIKSASILIGLLSKKFHPALTEITAYVINKIQQADIAVTITSAYRPLDEKSVHRYMRGIDFRTWDMDEKFINDLCVAVNTRWRYDPERPEKECLIYHDTGRGAHLHLQVHDATIRA